MTEILSGLWIGDSNTINDKEIMVKIDVPIDCNFKNNQYLSVDLEIQQFLEKINYFNKLITYNLNQNKNILIFNSNKNDRIEKSQIILVYFLMKNCQINFNTTVKLIIGKTKKILFKNEFYKKIFEKVTF